MLADLVRAFCNEPDNNYEVYENYSETKTDIFGEEVTTTTIGIAVKQEDSTFDALEQFNSYIESKGFDEQTMAQITDELEATSIADIGSNAVIYFPYIKDYQPL